MRKKKATQLTAWSWSRWTNYQRCPRQVFETYIKKNPLDKPSKAMMRGRVVHSGLERFLKGKGKFPGFASLLRTYYQDLVERIEPDDVELSLGLNANWEETGWFADDIWLRAKVDALVFLSPILKLIDHKTGRHYADDAKEQGELYAVCAFSLYDVKTVDVDFAYVDSGEIVPYRHKLKDYPKLQDKWEARAEIMLSDTTFDPTPSKRACGWCSYGVSKGGTCKEEKL